MRKRLINTSRIAVFFASLALVLGALPAGAQGLGGYRFDSFHADISLTQTGRLEVVETLRGEFLEERRGIFRFIPQRYKESGVNFTTGIEPGFVTYNGERAKTKWYREGDYQVLRIGQEDVYINGPFEYVIRYEVDRALLYHEHGDEIYWNVMGDQWDVVPTAVSATIQLPENVSPLENNCYTGQFESTETNCEIGVTENEVRFYAEDFLTISTIFPKGVVTEPSATEKAVQGAKDNLQWFALLIPLLIFGYLYRYWQQHGRDPKGRGTIYAHYEPPNDLRPTEVGTLIDGHFHAHDFSAAIVDLAVRGYLQIIEEEKKTFTLKKKKDADDSLKQYEKDILDGLFGSSDSVSLKSARTKLATLRKKVENHLYESMASDGYYVKNPNKVRSVFFVIGVVLFYISIFGITFAAITGNPVVVASLILSALIFLVFAFIMPKRTEKGAMAFEHARGFKMYLEKAEKYRIQWQEKKGVFEEFLPYAVVYGVSKKWAKTFEGTEELASSPVWYVGATPDFDASDFGKSIATFTSGIQTASTPKSSGGGGGGGFSGGGFGGGGGGSW